MMDEKRIIDLETKISYQEILIEELQKAVFEQYLSVEKKLKELSEKINSSQKNNQPHNEKPPHY